jgi:lipoic acid synthetase
MKPLSVMNLGLKPYDRALRLQHQLVAARAQGAIDDMLLLLQHPPVITLGRRGDETNILVPKERLAELGIEVHRVERGGDVTYHGPGQLVGYPILDLTHHRTDVGWYMHSLEEVLIRTLADFGIAACRLSGKIGVWLDERHKIGALGVRIDGWITYHGFALNVAHDLTHFQLIVPCGLPNVGVTSMEKVLRESVDMAAVRDRAAENFCAVFALEASQASLDDVLCRIGGCADPSHEGAPGLVEDCAGLARLVKHDRF